VRKRKLTQERLKELLDYNPDTGVFTRKVRQSGNAKEGAIAGSNTTGYIRIGVDGPEYAAHRLAFLWMEGYFPENEVDHIDRNPSNNRWNNLREVSHQCNVRNVGIRKDNTSGIPGVGWDSKGACWRAYIKLSKKLKHLGGSKDFSEAVRIRWKAEVDNDFPTCNSTSPAYQHLLSILEEKTYDFDPLEI
jgi:hypothetical protein